MSLRRRGRAHSAVGVEVDCVTVFFEPGGMKSNRFPVVVGKTSVIIGIGVIHTPVLFVVNVPADKSIIVAFKPERFGGRET